MTAGREPWFEARGARLTADRRDALRGLQEAFEEWASAHGLIWFDTDTRLAERIADALGVELNWTDRASHSQSVPRP